MSQYAMLEILMKEPDRWFSVDDMLEIGGYSISSTVRSLGALHKHGEVEVSYIKRKYKDGMKLKRHYRISRWYYDLWMKEKDKL